MKDIKNILDLYSSSFDYQNDVRKSYIYVPPKYESYLFRKLVGELTKHGKKHLANKLAQQIIDKIDYSDIIEMQKQLESNILLYYEFKPYRLGAYKYRIPINLSYHKARRQSYKRLFKLALKHKDLGIVNKISHEINDALNNVGYTSQRNNELIKLANANKAYQYLLR